MMLAPPPQWGSYVHRGRETRQGPTTLMPREASATWAPCPRGPSAAAGLWVQPDPPRGTAQALPGQSLGERAAGWVLPNSSVWPQFSALTATVSDAGGDQP